MTVMLDAKGDGRAATGLDSCCLNRRGDVDRVVEPEGVGWIRPGKRDIKFSARVRRGVGLLGRSGVVN